MNFALSGVPLSSELKCSEGNMLKLFGRPLFTRMLLAKSNSLSVPGSLNSYRPLLRVSSSLLNKHSHTYFSLSGSVAFVIFAGNGGEYLSAWIALSCISWLFAFGLLIYLRSLANVAKSVEKVRVVNFFPTLFFCQAIINSHGGRHSR